MIDSISMSILSSLKLLHNYFQIISPNHNNILSFFNNNDNYSEVFTNINLVQKLVWNTGNERLLR